MLIGVRGHDFGRKPVAELPKYLKSLGFETAQIALTKALDGVNSFEEIRRDAVENLAEELRKNQFPVAVLGCYIEPSLEDQEARLCNVEYFRQGIENAKIMGAQLIGTETTHFIDRPESDREKVYQLLKDSVQRMAEKAEQVGVDIGIEPVAVHTLYSAELARRLLDEVKSDRLKIIFDPCNMITPDTVDQQQEIIREFIDLLGREVSAIHLKDFVIKDGQMVWGTLGEGVMDYRALFDWLKKEKPEIALLREGATLDSYEKDIAFIRSFIG